MNILIVIPARGGSKGIPRKNVRLMNGKPLISYTIDNAKSSDFISDIVVSTDDPEILSIAKDKGIDCVSRKDDLSRDDITLDPVIYDAVSQMEENKKVRYDVVITLQATSPLLKVSTLNEALKTFTLEKYDSLISVVNNPHLSWGEIEGNLSPNYEERLNRQQLPNYYTETGAFLITARKFVTNQSRLGKNISVFQVSNEESIDIDTNNDWMLCEEILRKKKIVFRVDGYKTLGMGHIYHCLTLAYNLTGHEIMFVCKNSHIEGIKKIKESFMPYTLINDDNDFFTYLKNNGADIVINDCLDTQEDYIKTLKSIVKKVITIEDLGSGKRFADAVINALYNSDEVEKNEYYGEKYVCLRDEFLVTRPKEFSENMKNIIVMFGGTDPSNLTEKIYQLAKEVNKDEKHFNFYFITGPGYNLNKTSISTHIDLNIYIKNDVKRVTDYMKIADLAFTSQGRTVFELAAMGVPSVVIAQNPREQLHSFAQMKNGFLNLGLGKDISIDTLSSTFTWLAETPQIRYEMRNLMLKNELKKGINRVIDIILREE